MDVRAVRLLAIGAAACGLLAAGAAEATSYTLTGAFTVADQYNSGEVSFSNKLNFSGTSVPVGTATSATNFFTINPGSCVAGSGCVSSPYPTETDTITVSFNGLNIDGTTLANFTETATYTARYSGMELLCAQGDGKSPSMGATDCVAWTGASSTDHSGIAELQKTLGTTGYALDIFLYNATDWSITPKIAFEVQSVPQTPVPEPASLGIAAVGLAGLGWARRRATRA